VDDDPVSVDGDGDDGEGGHEHGHTGQGLHDPAHPTESLKVCRHKTWLKVTFPGEAVARASPGAVEAGIPVHEVLAEDLEVVAAVNIEGGTTDEPCPSAECYDLFSIV